MPSASPLAGTIRAVVETASGADVDMAECENCGEDVWELPGLPWCHMDSDEEECAEVDVAVVEGDGGPAAAAHQLEVAGIVGPGAEEVLALYAKTTDEGNGEGAREARAETQLQLLAEAEARRQQQLADDEEYRLGRVRYWEEKRAREGR